MLLKFKNFSKTKKRKKSTKKPKKGKTFSEKVVVSKKSKKIKIFSYTLYFLSAVCVLLAFYNLYFSTKILPGVYLNGENYSGLNKEQALQKINETAPKTQYLTITVEDIQDYQVTFDSVKITYLPNETYKTLFETGRENVFSHIYHITGFANKIDDKPYIYSVDNDLLNIELASISAKSFPSNQNAHFYIEGTEVKIKDADFGKNLDLKALKSTILKGLAHGQVNYVAQTLDFMPGIFASDLAVLKPQVTDYVNSGITLVYKDDYYPLTDEEVLTFLSFEKDDKEVVLIKPNNQNIRGYLAKFSSNINTDPKSLVFEISGDSINFEPPVQGIALKVDETSERLNDYVTSYFKGAGDTNEVLVAYTTTKPDPNANKYGITELISEGVSYFRGSAANRVRNVVTASNKVKGTLVAPGETFSFNKAVGPIDTEHGFNEAYVISKGRTVLGTGGGVCQVSTTVYRAALNSGLPVVDRTAHAYRVGYYEQSSALGLDATIYQPSVDLKFKNDTEYHILVYTEIDTAKQKLTVKIYGTGDGRTVDLSDTKKISELPPPEAIYEDTNELPKGVVEQTEWPAWGGTVQYTRVVKAADGTVMYNDTFKNYYKPWPAVYKRGV
jgi:vancomycin resistance protein YoaR